MTTHAPEPLVERAVCTCTASLDRLLKIGDVAVILGVGERTIERAITTGGIPAPIRLGDTRLWRREDVEGLLSIDALAAWLRISKSTINRLVEADNFPRPLDISTRVKRWQRTDVTTHLERLAKKENKRRGSR